jgi:hypothetical protein
VPGTPIKEKHNDTKEIPFKNLHGKKQDWKLVSKTYTRLPGQQMTVRVTLFLCSFNMGTRAEWLMPTVERPFTATIMSPHLDKNKKRSKMLF